MGTWFVGTSCRGRGHYVSLLLVEWIQRRWCQINLPFQNSFDEFILLIDNETSTMWLPGNDRVHLFFSFLEHTMELDWEGLFSASAVRKMWQKPKTNEPSWNDLLEDFVVVSMITIVVPYPFIIAFLHQGYYWRKGLPNHLTVEPNSENDKSSSTSHFSLLRGSFGKRRGGFVVLFWARARCRLLRGKPEGDKSTSLLRDYDFKLKSLITAGRRVRYVQIKGPAVDLRIILKSWGSEQSLLQQ